MTSDYLVVIVEKPAAWKGEDLPQLGLGLARLDQLTSAPSKKQQDLSTKSRKTISGF
jgi:hypothetical protein